MMDIWSKDKAKAGKWYQLPLAGCVSSNNKPYRITFKKGDTNNLLVNFFGGGLSWNAETAAKPITLSTMLRGKEYFYIPNVPAFQLKFIHIGLLSATDKRNPFHNWYMLNIPYESADFHIGNNEFAYQDVNGKDKILYHHGQKNVSSALAALKEFFPQTPETLIITGQSAGGFGCVAHAPQIQSLYPDCNNTVVYSEGTHLHCARWSDIAKHTWKVNPDLMKYIKSEDLLIDLFRYAKDHMPPSTLFLHSNTVWDKILVEMMYKMNHGEKLVNSEALEEFHDTLLNTVKILKKEIPNYYYFLTDYKKKKKNGTTPHTFAGNPKLLYNKIQDDTSVVQWLNLAINGKAVNVGEKFLKI